ncbi:MAG: bifunctional heptose 7-phosphate kinase/heptose 1-phosphate adenyltransferase [Gemmatimonadales bacterium]
MPGTLAPVSPDRLDELVKRMAGTRIAVVGDVMLDRYLVGDAERISAEAPVPVVTVKSERDAPGGAANVAASIAATGAIPLLAGCIGDDPAGMALNGALAALGIATSGLVTVPGRPTTCKTRLIAQGQQVVRIDSEVDNRLPDRFRDALAAAANGRVAEADVLLIEDYDKGVMDASFASELIAAARARPIPIVVDPKLRHFFAFSGATVFKPNRAELDAAFAAQFTGDDADLENARRRVGAEHLVLTLGAEGVALVSPGQPIRRGVGIAREVFDVSGAGDSVAAWIALSLAAGADMGEAAWLANIAAGLKVGKRGTAVVTPEEMAAAAKAMA